MTFGQRLKQVRVERGLSQSEVADKLIISRQSISRWETDKGYPDLDRLVQLSALYEISTDQLLKENAISNAKTSETSKPVLQVIDESYESEKDDGLMLLVLSAISSLLFPIGLIIVPFVMLRNKKHNTLYRLVYVIGICAFVTNLFFLYNHGVNYFGPKDTKIERVK